MPHPEGDSSPPDQWEDSDELTEDTARQVVPWTTMTGRDAPKNFRAVPVPADEEIEVPVAPVPKGLSALESVTSSQRIRQQLLHAEAVPDPGDACPKACNQGQWSEQGERNLLAEFLQGPESWMKDAKCSDKAPNLRQNPDASDPWFPRKGESPNSGKVYCFTCPVRAECKDYRQRTGSGYGMWGGEIKGRE